MSGYYAWGQQVTSEEGWDQLGKKNQPLGKILRSFLLIFIMWGHNGKTAIYDSVYIQADSPAAKSARDLIMDLPASITVRDKFLLI